MAKIIELIISTENRGTGTKTDVVREITILWTKDGHKIAEFDPTDRDVARLEKLREEEK